jgi:hypothetical protein
MPPLRNEATGHTSLPFRSRTRMSWNSLEGKIPMFPQRSLPHQPSLGLMYVMCRHRNNMGSARLQVKDDVAAARPAEI